MRVLRALSGVLTGRWFTLVGAGSAVLILAGVLSPLDVPVLDQANFIGYIMWSLWLVAFGVLLLVRPPDAGRVSQLTGTIGSARGR